MSSLLIQYPKDLFSISGRGLFSCFAAVIRNMEWAYEKNMNVSVNLDNCINYYKAPEGSQFYTNNVWSQFYGNDELIGDVEVITDLGHVNIFNKRDLQVADVERWRKIHDRYFRLLPKIQEEVASYNIIGSETLGLHIRGTDKKEEVRLKSPQEWEAAIHKEIAEGGFKRTILCTDDLSICQYFQARAHLFNLEITRSYRSNETNSFDSSRFYVGTDPYSSGKGAVVDYAVLSQCSTIIRTQCSNLSAFSCLGKNVQKIVNM